MACKNFTPKVQQLEQLNIDFNDKGEETAKLKTTNSKQEPWDVPNERKGQKGVKFTTLGLITDEDSEQSYQKARPLKKKEAKAPEKRLQNCSMPDKS